MKKSFWETTVGKIAVVLSKIALGSFLKRRKFNKTEKDEKNINDIIDQI